MDPAYLQIVLTLNSDGARGTTLIMPKIVHTHKV